MSGHPASHLGGDAGAGAAAALRWGQQQGDPEDPASPCQEEGAWPELQQSTRFVQRGAGNAGWAKPASSPPSPALQQAQEPALGGHFSFIFFCVFKEGSKSKKKKKKAYKTFLPSAAP